MLTQVAVQTTPEGNFRVTVNQKILVHLLEFIRYQERSEVPRDVTQQGIAQVVNARRSHVSLALSTLKERGLVEERTTRITDEVRRKKAYGLTSKGYELTKKLVKDFMSRKVRVEGSGGIKDVKIESLQEVLGDKYYLVDVLCCISREGTLDIAALTGQEAEGPAAPEQERPEPQTIGAPTAEPGKPEEKPALTAAPEKEAQRARAVCPACQSIVEFPYEGEGLMTVICGYCGSTFRSAVGAPMLGEFGSTEMTKTQSFWQEPSKVDRTRMGLGFLIVAATLSLASSFLVFWPLVSTLPCLVLIAAIPFIAIALAFVKDQAASILLIVSLVSLILVFPLLMSSSTTLVAINFLFLSTSLQMATAVHLGMEPRKKLAAGAVFVVAAAVLPFAQWWTVMMGVGLLVGAGILFGLSIPRFDRKSMKDRDVIALSGVVTGLGIITFLHWVFYPFWDWWAVGRAWMLGATIYAFVLFAKPIAPKLRSEVTVVAGTFMMSLAACIAIGPWLIGWGVDVAAYSLVFGAGAIYLADRVHKVKDLWPLACLGIGLFIVMYSALTLALSWEILAVQWKAVLVLWMVVGIALCVARFVPEVIAHVSSLRAGVISAIGAAMVLAGLYMLTVGLAFEGAIEAILGVPLLGYALFKSGAPWKLRLIVMGLFVTVVAVTWFALVTSL